MTLTPTQQEKITALKNAMDGYFVNESDIATSFSDNPSDAKVASEKLMKDSLDSKADKVALQDITGKEDKTNKSSSISTDTGSTTKYPTVKAVEDYAQPIGNYLTSHQDITGKEDKSNKVTSISSSSTDTEYPSAKCVYDELETKINIIEAINYGRKNDEEW